VTCDRLTGDLLVISAPTITMPPISIVLPSPLLEVMNCARPMVPPAPPLLSTVTRGTILSACSAACNARPVWSQPPPGAAGTMTLRLSSAVAQGVASSKAPLAMAVERRRRTSTIFMGLVSGDWISSDVVPRAAPGAFNELSAKHQDIPRSRWPQAG